VVDTDVVDLLDTRVAVGEAVFEGTRPRPPCAHVEAVASEDGLAAALSAERGGICADVLAGDTVAVDDDLRVVERLDDHDGSAARLSLVQFGSHVTEEAVDDLGRGGVVGAVRYLTDIEAHLDDDLHRLCHHVGVIV